MKICPDCGGKDYPADHRGSFKQEKCASCSGGSMKKVSVPAGSKAVVKKAPFVLGKASPLPPGAKKIKRTVPSKKLSAFYGA